MPDRGGLPSVAAVLLLGLVLALPDRPAPPALPYELPLVLLLLLAPMPLTGAARFAVTGFLTALVAVKLADVATWIAFRRPFNPMLDGDLVVAGARLTAGSIGWPLTAAAIAACLIATGALAAGLWWASGRIARWPRPGRAAVVLLGTAALALPFVAPAPAPLAARLVATHVSDGLEARRDLARFRIEAAADSQAVLPPEAILPGLRGTDILLVFVESYGRTALENPASVPSIAAALADLETSAAAAGLEIRSGALAAPIVGGQSWLARATLVSGLRIDTQGRYRALLASPRRTLMHLAREAGWQTAVVAPAITLPWPEARWFGYDRVLAAADLGYAGPAFNWVTMPDQYTLAAVERLLLDPAPRAPLFAEIALISSHAPWTPVPPLLPWSEIGDGRVFAAAAAAGDPPEVVWRDADRVRDQYRQALAYALRCVAGFVARRRGQAPLIIVLGDHPPAGFVSGDPQGRDVPVHVIGPPELLESLAPWGWTRGPAPAPTMEAWPMESFRDRFLAAFATKP